MKVVRSSLKSEWARRDCRRPAQNDSFIMINPWKMPHDRLSAISISLFCVSSMVHLSLFLLHKSYTVNHINWPFHMFMELFYEALRYSCLTVQLCPSCKMRTQRSGFWDSFVYFQSPKKRLHDISQIINRRGVFSKRKIIKKINFNWILAVLASSFFLFVKRINDKLTIFSCLLVQKPSVMRILIYQQW